MPEVSSQTRSLLSGSNPYQKLPICVEISLKTSEGDSMILETWLLSMTDSSDHPVCLLQKAISPKLDNMC
jgi:autophagy-related protein 13